MTIDLDALTTAELVALAHAVAAMLRRRIFDDAPDATEKAREWHRALVAAGYRGVAIGALQAVLIGLDEPSPPGAT